MNTRVCLRSPEVPGFWPSIGAVSTMLTATNRSPLRFGVMFVVAVFTKGAEAMRSEEHTSELQSLMRISYAVFCLKKKNIKINMQINPNTINKQIKYIL